MKESPRDETIRRLAGENAVPKPCKGGIHTPAIVHRTGGPSAALYNTCGDCGEAIVMCEDSWVAKKDTILCKRCNGDGDVPARSDELERVSCPVCDGQPYIDYAGEYFWGGVSKAEQRARLLVTPCRVTQ